MSSPVPSRPVGFGAYSATTRGSSCDHSCGRPHQLVSSSTVCRIPPVTITAGLTCSR
ncbi:hypothetical protein PYK79_16065 [Streptomyces sp. ID05-04B]|uniref:hypothetical protein n=1 Tax=unclassified Streptomyces TaxID=2593676 RepID=UPI00131F448D|nr:MULTISPECIES: hypothetical protein [unclassified Streptomyces]MDX5564561.1 hypothetical protein [Streptomyces sp. ID05-04B]